MRNYTSQMKIVIVLVLAVSESLLAWSPWSTHRRLNGLIGTVPPTHAPLTLGMRSMICFFRAWIFFNSSTALVDPFLDNSSNCPTRVR